MRCLFLLFDFSTNAPWHAHRDVFNIVCSAYGFDLLVDPREHPVSTAEFRQRLEQLGSVRRHPFSRFAHYGGDDGVDWLFVAGEEYRIDSRQRAFAQVLCQWRELHFGFVAEWIECEDCLALMTQLCNAGHLELPDAD